MKNQLNMVKFSMIFLILLKVILIIFQQNYTAYQSAFLASDLGKICTAIPWQDLLDSFGLKDAGKGPQSMFSPRCSLYLFAK